MPLTATEINQLVDEIKGILPEIKTFPGMKDEVKTMLDELKQAKADQAANLPDIEQLKSDLWTSIEEKIAKMGTGGRKGQFPTGGKGPEPEEDYGFKSFGDFMHCLKFKPEDERVKKVKALSVDVGSSGGVLVPPQFRSELMKIDPQAAIFRPRCVVIPPGSPPDAEITIPALNQGADGVYSGVTVTWIEEGAEKPETQPGFRDITLKPHEVAAHTVMNDKLLRNAPAASTLVQTLLRQAMTAAEDVTFLKGNGVGKPLGVLGHASAINVNRAVPNQIGYADIVTMYANAMFGGPLVWVGSQTILPQLTQMVDGGGNLVWQPNGRDGIPGTLMGLPLIWNHRQPPLGTAGDLMLVDLRYYLIKDGSGPFVELSPHVYFTSNKTVVKAFWNVDGQPWLDAPLRLEDGVTDVSPFVVLQ